MFAKAIATVPLLILAAGCASRTVLPQVTQQPSGQSFAAIADSIVNNALSETQWGIEIYDPQRNASTYGFNELRHFIPASNTKLVVTTVGMGLLGRDFRYATELLIAGAANEAAPTALIVVGSGDPTWSERFHDDDFTVLRALADSLVAKGITRIAGDLIVDASYFAPERIHGSWEVGDLPWGYATGTAAFAIGEATALLVATGGVTFNEPVTVEIIGAPAPLPIVNRLLTDTAGARVRVDIDHHVWPDSLVLTGWIPIGRVDSTHIALPDPELYAARAFAAALDARGIDLTGNIRIIRDTAAARAIRASSALQPVVTWTSTPLRDIVAAILQPSQNWIAEQLLKTLGAERGEGGTWAAGIEVERRYLIDVIGIDSTAFFLRDASGLSVQNLLTPRATIRLLEHARHAHWAADYRNALPAPGMQEGTLENRLQGLEASVRAKTGSITNVNTLSGYLTTAGGKDLTFSIMSNASGRSSAEIRRAIDRLVQALAQGRD